MSAGGAAGGGAGGCGLGDGGRRGDRRDVGGLAPARAPTGEGSGTAGGGTTTAGSATGGAAGGTGATAASGAGAARATRSGSAGTAAPRKTSSRPRASRRTSTDTSGGTCRSTLTSEAPAAISRRSSFAGVAASSAGSNPSDGVQEKRRPPAKRRPRSASMMETRATSPSRWTATRPGVPDTRTRTARRESRVVRLTDSTRAAAAARTSAASRLMTSGLPPDASDPCRSRSHLAARIFPDM